MSQKVHYKLINFTERWLGEPIRYLFSYVGADFEDFRVEWDDWVAGKVDKSVYRYAKLPILEEHVKAEDGSQTKVASISQSFTILKYLGRKYNLYGKDLLEEAKCDEIADYIKDILKEIDEIVLGEDKARRSKLRATLLTVTIPRYFSVFEEELKAKKNASGTFPLVGDKITWVDFFLAYWSEEFQTFLLNKNYIPEGDTNKDVVVLAAYPTIRKHQEWVNGLKGVREWREGRPASEF